MLQTFFDWFNNLPFLLQVLGYLLAAPVAFAALGVIICFGDDTAGGFVDDHGLVLGLIMLGFIGSIFLGSIFGVTYLLENFIHLPFWLSFIIGMFFGLVVVPFIWIKIASRKI